MKMASTISNVLLVLASVLLTIGVVFSWQGWIGRNIGPTDDESSLGARHAKVLWESSPQALRVGRVGLVGGGAALAAGLLLRVLTEGS